MKGNQNMESNLLNVGYINNVRGLKGEIKVMHYCDSKEQFSEISHFVIEDKSYEKEYVKYHKEQVILKLKGINTISEAEKLKSKDIYADRSELPKLKDGQYYIADLIGFEAYTDKNELIGKVSDVIVSAASDLFQIKNKDGKNVLVPNIPEFINEISLEDKKIIITPIEGLL